MNPDDEGLIRHSGFSSGFIVQRSVRDRVSRGEFSRALGRWDRNWKFGFGLNGRPVARASEARLLENRGVMDESDLFHERTKRLIRSGDSDENLTNTGVAGGIVDHGAERVRFNFERLASGKSLRVEN
jgi:hypothetical protein